MHTPARATKRSVPLNGAGILKVMRNLFPKRNSYGDASYEELVGELERLGLRTIGEFERLMKRHRRRLLEIDREPLDKWHVSYFSYVYGDTEVKDALRRQYWFSYPALVRTAAELEWGAAAEVFEDSEI